MKKSPAKKSNAVAVAATGLGIAAGLIGAYLLFGPEGKTNRKKVKGWAVKMKGEMIEKFEKAKDLNEETYNKIVDEIAVKYAKLKDIDQADLQGIVKDARKHWKSLMAESKKKITKKVATKKVAKKKA